MAGMHPLPECPSNAVLHVQWANVQTSFIVARDAAMMFQPSWAVVCAEYPQSLGAMLGAEVDLSLQQLERLARHSRFGFAALPLRLEMVCSQQVHQDPSAICHYEPAAVARVIQLALSLKHFAAGEPPARQGRAHC